MSRKCDRCHQCGKPYSGKPKSNPKHFSKTTDDINTSHINTRYESELASMFSCVKHSNIKNATFKSIKVRQCEHKISTGCIARVIYNNVYDRGNFESYIDFYLCTLCLMD